MTPLAQKNKTKGPLEMTATNPELTEQSNAKKHYSTLPGNMSIPNTSKGTITKTELETIFNEYRSTSIFKSIFSSSTSEITALRQLANDSKKMSFHGKTLLNVLSLQELLRVPRDQKI